MKKKRVKSKKEFGFTLIEVILVIALLGSVTAMAAPELMDVFDGSKDKADVAQMDFLLNAFQIQQAPFYEDHNGRYDMLNSNNTPEGALKHFLQDALTDPGSTVYIEGVKRVKTGETSAENNPVFIPATSATHVWIESKDHKNKSNIKLRIPGTETIDRKYTDGEMLKGTWMIIGDDDRLRADYVKNLLFHVREEDGKEVNDEAYQAFKNKVNRDHEYRYRTMFKIDANLEKEDPISIDKAWITFDSQYAGNHNFFIFNNVTEKDVESYLTVLEYQNGRIKKTTEIGKLPKGSEMFKSPPGHSGTPGNDKHEVRYVFTFKKNGEYIGKITHKIHFIHKNNVTSEMLEFLNSNNNGVEEGYYDTGATAFKYFHHLYDPAMSDLESGTNGLPGSGSTPAFIFHTGAVFNINNVNNGKYNNYDFLSFEENDDGEMALRSYCVQGGSVSGFKSEAILNGFEFGKTYTMELIVNKGKATVNLSHNLLDESAKVFITSQDLHPALGYYMNQQLTLAGQEAVAEEQDHLPIVSYEDDGNTGPQFVLLGMPEIHPYQTENNNDEPDEPEDPEEPKPGLVRFQYDCDRGKIELDSKNDHPMEYKWVYNLNYEGDDPNLSNDIKDAGESDGEGSVSCGRSGWLFARDMIEDKGSGPWYKTPWVNIEDYTIEMVSTEVTGKPEKQKISYQPEELPNNFNWYIRGSGDEKEAKSIRIKNALKMKEIDVQAYVKWKNQTKVSVSKGEGFGYHDFGADVNQDPFEVRGKLSPVNGNRYNLQILSEDQYKLSVTAYHYKKGTIQYDFTQPQTTIDGNSSELNLGKGFTNLRIEVQDMEGNTYLIELTSFPLGEFLIS